MRIGAHVSVMGDYRKMARYAESVGCECVQIFAKNARSYAFAMPDASKISQMAEVYEEHPDLVVYSHSAYLINLSTSKSDIRSRSIEALAGELAIAAMLGISGVNTHVGNDPDGDPAAAAERAARSIVDARERACSLVEKWSAELGMDSPAIPPLILENAAGSGRLFGCSPQEISEIAHRVDFLGLPDGDPAELLWTCIDTAHAWAAGYDVSSESGWESLLDEIDAGIGIPRLRLLHVNDSKFPLGSRKDRHEWVGEGCIGLEGFAFAMRSPRLAQTDAILEVPGDTPIKDERNISVLKELRNAGG